MPAQLEFLEGKKFCIVFVKVIDMNTERVQLQCFRGRANVERGKLSVVDTNGALVMVPSTALSNIMPSDGSSLLKDAEFFCLVKVDDSMELASLN